MGKNLSIKVHTAGLWKAGQSSPEPGRIVVPGRTGLDLFLPPGLALADFEKALRAAARQQARFSSLKCCFDGFSLLFFSLVFSVGIATLFGLLGLYEDLFKRLLIEGNLVGTAQRAWFVLSALLFVFMVTLVPSVLAGEDSKFREWLQKWYNHAQRVQRRILRTVSLLLRDEVPEIRLWNCGAFAEDSWVWNSLVPALRNSRTDLALHVGIGQERQTLARLGKDATSNSCELVHGQLAEGSEELPIELLPRVLEMMDSGDQLLLDLLILCSTDTLPPAWRKTLSAGDARLRGMISLGLAEFVLFRFGSSLLPDQAEATTHALAAFVRRCQHDYRLLIREQIGQHSLSRLAACLEKETERVRNRFVHLRDQLESELPVFLKANTDPLAGLVLLGLSESAGLPPRARQALLENLLETSRREEMYFLVPALWRVLAQDRDTAEPGNRLLTYGGLSLQSLQHLCELLERSGCFDEALDLARHLRPVHPAKYAMDIARLLERTGQYDQAFAALRDEPGLCTLRRAIPPNEIALRYNLHLSWTVVSGRLEQHKAEGAAALEQARGILDQCLDQQRDPYLLWRYHNNRANYAEWDEDLVTCIEEHHRCIEIPGIEQKWLSGSQVNLGIAYRMLFRATQDPGAMEKALHFAQEGLRLKRQIGDYDELPVTLHNAALTLLEAHLSFADAHFQIDLNQALAMTEQGLDILARTVSTKKQGLLLAERCILAQLLNVDPAQRAAFGNALQKWLEQAPTLAPADLKVVREILARAETSVDCGSP
ncbi:tetratricopeptide repeat protein [Geoalkalibacter sp.]|uniref:tetratricopeptide repeat protein n=1 Tax=Geoalkalibacter sp. TaxID=3041440 RepID=UPI00272E981A|nr:hypothetical protein [Geoalkalibacter sp.]